MGNIYVITYLVNRQLRKKMGKLVIMFVDLKTAIVSADKVDWSNEEARNWEKLVERMEKVVRETKSRISVKREIAKGFWTTREVG
jgi:gas vesicle protein